MFRLSWYDETSKMSGRGKFIFRTAEKIETIAMGSGLVPLGARRSEPCIRYWIDSEENPDDRDPAEIVEEAAAKLESSAG